MAKHGKKSKSEPTGKSAPSPKKPAHKKAEAEAALTGVLDEALTYVLRHAAAALRGTMAEALRPLDLSAAQHSCLELLGRSPGMSSSDLARGAFVSRQSMNLVLRGLQDRGLVTRLDTAPQGRALPTTLTAEGRQRLNAANTVARSVEKQMLAAVPEKRRARFRADLAACAAVLTPAD
ncbi:MarR family transcriptional regulator [Glaciihabitans sp. INWT7]|uniref:MarR family winged helix-turn-helix transcriptional regulator n=1 Tax=Glaciihabitans sp. INWT7 TaxID=2596912 RepID=UPI001627BE14|nr:MarR family transcriptional regulator [Glaciihabitans sp. INWT7]QNE45704.1 MarR family transcriptional regulator [Glaciihabitans sp. INWT7]